MTEPRNERALTHQGASYCNESFDLLDGPLSDEPPIRSAEADSASSGILAVAITQACNSMSSIPHHLSPDIYRMNVRCDVRGSFRKLPSSAPQPNFAWKKSVDGGNCGPPDCHRRLIHCWAVPKPTPLISSRNVGIARWQSGLVATEAPALGTAQPTASRRLQDHPQWISDDLIEGFDDSRFEIALAVIMGARRTTRVTFDLTNLVTGGWLLPDERPHQTSRERLTNRTAFAGFVIVVSEGRTDAELLRPACTLGRPEVAEQFRFLDSESCKAEGGAAQVPVWCACCRILARSGIGATGRSANILVARSRRRLQ